MIKTSRQIKDLVRNMSNGNSLQSQTIIRNYMMERFLERLSLSNYKNNFILKGGMLVSAMVGIDARSTMDIDTTVKNLSLSIDTLMDAISKIISVPIDDSVIFTVKHISKIMDEAEYNGFRVSLDASMDSMQIPIKIDISTGDIITPTEISYQFKLMFEDRKISVVAYNLETVLAEKLETVISRGITNTRLRDFYDLYVLTTDCSYSFDLFDFSKAFTATCIARETISVAKNGQQILNEVANSEVMQKLWENYQMKFSYASEIDWINIIKKINFLYNETEFYLKKTRQE